jgi:hypothetical protein
MSVFVVAVFGAVVLATGAASGVRAAGVAGALFFADATGATGQLGNR